MPTQVSTLPAQHAKAYADFIAWLKAGSAQIRAYNVNLWRVFDGGESTTLPDPTPDQCPQVRFTPKMLPMTRYCARAGKITYQAPMEIEVDTVFAGTNAATAMNLWAALLDRAMAWDGRPSGVHWFDPGQPAQAVNDSKTIAVASGTFRMALFTEY